jgi:proteasome lid subunit RPN8/RPN11
MRLFRKKREKAVPPACSVWMSCGLLLRTGEILRKSGTSDEAHEGVTYWAGHRAHNESFVTTVIAPFATTTSGSFVTSSASNAHVIAYLAKAGLELLAQVHSHPGRFVGHSRGDDERALMPYEGFLSIVVPDYARRGLMPLSTCGVHIFQAGTFRRMNETEIARCFHVVDETVNLR